MESQRQQSVWDFPGGPAVQSPCTARDAGSAPGQGTKIPQAMEQLSLYHNLSLCPPKGGSPMMQGRSQVPHWDLINKQINNFFFF